MPAGASIRRDVPDPHPKKSLLLRPKGSWMVSVSVVRQSRSLIYRFIPSLVLLWTVSISTLLAIFSLGSLGAVFGACQGRRIVSPRLSIQGLFITDRLADAPDTPCTMYDRHIDLPNNYQIS
jgi:hypothetical protein